MQKTKPILTYIIFGTRPEAIKMAPVVNTLKQDNNFKVKVIITAQHREMLDQVLNIFKIKPDIDLNIMQKNQTLSQITAKVLTKLQEVIDKEKPQLILVHGDTTTTLAASLVAYYNKITLGHIEAGLRTHNKFHPYPEEVNRLFCDYLSDIYFCPTASAKKNLLRENINKQNIFVTGNTVIDALYQIVKQNKKLPQNLIISTEKNNVYLNKKFILVTTHRRESFGEPLQQICLAIKYLLSLNLGMQFFVSLHKNPQARKQAEEILGKEKNVYLSEPVDYFTFVSLMQKSYFILTDSGGIQEEAPSLGKPVLVLREVTERPEAVKYGTVKLVGRSKEKIIKYALKLWKDKKFYAKMQKSINPYGDGKASPRVKQALLYIFKLVKNKASEFSC